MEQLDNVGKIPNEPPVIVGQTNELLELCKAMDVIWQACMSEDVIYLGGTECL